MKSLLHHQYFQLRKDITDYTYAPELTNLGIIIIITLNVRDIRGEEEEKMRYHIIEIRLVDHTKSKIGS